jgi:hypothetical protein
MTATQAEYAAASWGIEGDAFHWLELQVRPGSISLYISTDRAYRARRAEWTGEYAVAVGHAVAAGEMPPAVFADWIDEFPPVQGGRDVEFKAAEWMRRAVK